ncbi:helix-turn-helix domain-containing protein [Methylobacterium brachiatum]|uniref:helix-turn-helix domain-containing protein n=1 Tax=Methylobacterium brachiatum TaxID=269660 RepID=UPI002447E26A|nr:helix-turn-helix domain-containing protein [Methylobacterium brachiatum]MDH2313614.1 helix-turn-helix domain-containing protein [Methylobacterium brachiatum]
MQPVVPRYFLYGEPLQAADDGFVHLEDLDDRSRPAAWQIHPHAHADLHQVFWIREGRGTITAEGDAIAFAAPCAILVPAGVVHGFVYEASSTGRVLTISDRVLRSLTRDERTFLALFEGVACLVLPEAARFDSALHGIQQEQASAAPGQRVALAAHLSLALVGLARLASQHAVGEPKQLAAHARIVARFRSAIEEHYAKNFSLPQYCALIGTTMGRLRSACRTITYATPGQMIADRLSVEAKRLLRYSDLPVSEVAYRLGFEDPAYFSRFFTRTVGSTPSAFRRGK